MVLNFFYPQQRPHHDHDNSEIQLAYATANNLYIAMGAGSMTEKIEESTYRKNNIEIK